MKKLRKNVVLCMALILALAGCADKTKDEKEHVHEAGKKWECNETSHWKVCECGEQIDVEEHVINDSKCEICGAEIWDMGDGSVMLITYNEFGDLEIMRTYDEEGNVTCESISEYETDSDGNKVSAKYYEDGVLQTEETYLTTQDGVNYVAESKGYFDDGTWYVNEYDENSNVVRAYSCDKTGNITSDSTYEYSYNEAGECYESKMTSVDENCSTVTEYNEHGDMLRWEYYDAEGNLENVDVYEYGYDDEGQKLWLKQYTNDVLVHEVVNYATAEDEYGTTRYEQKVIEYNEDGTKTVYEYDENGNVIDVQ